MDGIRFGAKMITKTHLNKTLKWTIIIIATLFPFTFYLIPPQLPFSLPMGVCLGAGLVMGREAYIFFLPYEDRYSLSWITFHKKRRDVLVSVSAFMSIFAIAIINHMVMEQNNLDRFVIGGFFNIILPVSIIIFGGSKELRRKIFSKQNAAE